MTEGSILYLNFFMPTLLKTGEGMIFYNKYNNNVRVKHLVRTNAILTLRVLLQLAILRI